MKIESILNTKQKFGNNQTGVEFKIESETEFLLKTEF